MNRRIIISLGIILVLILYLLFANNSKNGKNIPEIKGWEKDPDEILISKGDKKVRIYKDKGIWLVGDKGFPADDQKVDSLVDKMKEIRITDFVSEGPYYEMYNLTSDKAIRVTIQSSDAIYRDILIGKKSSTFKSSYIKFVDDKDIYLARGALTDEFNKDVAELRSKEIYSISKDAVESLELRYKGSKITFTRVEDEDKKEEEKKAEKGWICNEFKGVKLNKSKVDSLVTSFSKVNAKSFPELEKKSLRGTLCIVMGRAYDKNVTLSIHSKKDDEYICSSSESPYVFTLSQWNAERFFKTLSDFTEKKSKK